MEVKHGCRDEKTERLSVDILQVKKLDSCHSEQFQTPAVSKNHTLFIKDESKSMHNEASDKAKPFDYFEFKLWKEKRWRINKSLCVFRIGQILWFGAGTIPTYFFSIFIKQRGLTVVEISSAFSMIFIFQLLSCSISGIIADKIGNSKPVLLVLMFLSSSILFSLVLVPNVTRKSCVLEDHTFNRSNLSEYIKEFNTCLENCLFNNINPLPKLENYGSNRTFMSESDLINIELLDLKINNTRNLCHSFYSSSTNISLSKLYCCNICANRKISSCTSERSVRLVVVYAALIIAFYSIFNAAFRFMNFSAISLATKHSSHFGKETAVSKCGETIVIILIAFVVTTDKSSESRINYNLIMCIAAGIMLCACFVLFLTSVPILPPGKNLLKNAFSLLKDIDVLVFVLLVFVAGNETAFANTFRLIFLETIGAPNILIALHSVAAVLYGFPVLLYAKWCLKKFGCNKLCLLCLLSHAINIVAYSFISNPWWILVIDISIAFTNDLFWIAVVTNCWNVAPIGFAATLNALTGATHFGIGRSSGVFFGGMLINYMGSRNAYRIMSAISFSTAILYSIFIYKRHRSSLTGGTIEDKENTDASILKITNIQEGKNESR